MRISKDENPEFFQKLSSGLPTSIRSSLLSTHE